MMIGSIGGGSGVPAGAYGAGQAMDSYSKNIQKQIEQTQKQLQELSENSEMTTEEKMKKRQELQKKITDLNNQLRQHQMDVRREKQREERALAEEKAGTDKNRPGESENGFSTTAMKAVVSADASLKQAQAQRGVAVSMKGRAGVLEAEIKQDAGRGQSVEAKKEELADVKQKASAAEASQMRMLKEANGAWEKADAENNAKEDDKKEASNGRPTDGAVNADEKKEQDSDNIKGYKTIDVLL